MRKVKNALLTFAFVIFMTLSSCSYQRFNANYLEKTYESTNITVDGNPPINFVSSSMTFKYIDEATYISSQSINVYKDTSISPNRYVSYEFKYVNELNEAHSISFKTDIVGYDNSDGIKMQVCDSELDETFVGLYANKKNGRDVTVAVLCIWLRYKVDLSTSGVYFITLE